VHRLPSVDREDVILPEPALKLLDRNVLRFVGTRDALRRLGQSTRKGILLYGPPGTGKTHTIRYLATNPPGHTTLLVAAEQVGLLGPYMTLARLLQPTMVVIEDVDLIASDRDDVGPCEESLLNKLLNEMDGLKEDADILFVLTTNRPEALEGALAGRPGRIDQAIEVPLPDATGRGKLVRLYGKGLPLDEPVVTEAVRRTEGVSAAFIKELMRRIAQSASPATAAIRSRQATSTRRLTICCSPAAGSTSSCSAVRRRWPRHLDEREPRRVRALAICTSACTSRACVPRP
jgi:ATP-dependent 26S proteasome regulatory subunit